MKFINNTDQIKNDSLRYDETFDQSGNPCSDEDLAAAKKVAIGTTVKHFIKQSKRQRRLFNPIIDKIDQKSVLRTENEFLFQEVNKDCFDEYIKYLKNRNSYFFLQANNYWKR